MSSLGEMLSACAGRSADQELAWQLYLDWRNAGSKGVAADGPALPPAILEERVNAEVDLALVDLGVYHDTLYKTTPTRVIPPTPAAEPVVVRVAAEAAPDTGSAQSVVEHRPAAVVPAASTTLATPRASAPKDPPTGVILQGPGGLAAAARPYSGVCGLHDDCMDHGVVLDHEGRSYVHHECESGSRALAAVPAALSDRLAEPPDKLFTLLRYAESHPLVMPNGGHDAGNHTKIPYWDTSFDDGDWAPDIRLPVDDAVRASMHSIWPFLNPRDHPRPAQVADPLQDPDPDLPVNLRASVHRVVSDVGSPIAPRTAGFDCRDLFHGGYFHGTAKQLERINKRRCVHDASYDEGCCTDPDISD